MKKNFLIFSVLNILIAFSGMGQGKYLMYNLGGGSSTFGGFSLNTSLAFEKNKNEFTLRSNFNNETGHLTKSIIGHSRYNDRLLDVAVLYGRTSRKKEWFMFSASAGLAFYNYNDRSLGDPVTSFVGTYRTVKSQRTVGLGIALQTEVQFIVTEGFGFNLNSFGNINPDRTFFGLDLSCVWIFGND